MWLLLYDNSSSPSKDFVSIYFSKTNIQDALKTWKVSSIKEHFFFPTGTVTPQFFLAGYFCPSPRLLESLQTVKKGCEMQICVCCMLQNLSWGFTKVHIKMVFWPKVGVRRSWSCSCKIKPWATVKFLNYFLHEIMKVNWQIICLMLKMNSSIFRLNSP